MNKFSYSWTTKFSTERGFTLRSFNASCGEFKMSWGLETVLNPNDETCEDYVSVYLHLIDSNKEEVWADYKFSIFNNKGEKIRSLKSKQPCKFDAGMDWGFKKFIKRDFLLDESNGLITDNEYEIVSEVTVLPEFNGVPDLSQTLEDEEPACRLFDNLWSLYATKKFVDVTLVVGDTEFKAHKIFLAAQSPVFSAMFDHEMKESKQNQVNITDIHSTVFEELLHFIYTGESPNLEIMVEDLLAAADKYQLEKLKFMCGKALFKNLNIENACKLLMLSDRHSMTQIKMQAVNFINSHAKDVIETNGFNFIKTAYPHLLAEIYKDLAIKMEKYITDKHQDPVSNIHQFYVGHPDSHDPHDLVYY